MADKQKQEVGNGALALQAGGDIKIGMSFTEVEHLFTVLFENNFPKLQEVAARTAQDNVVKFVDGLKEIFVANSSRIDLNKIADPDVQYMFNGIIEASARKGCKVNPELLSELVVQRLSNDSTEIMNIVCSEAAGVISKLSKEQIALMTLCQFVSNVTFTEFNHVLRFEPFGILIEPLVNPCKGISETSIEFLTYAGILSISTILGSDIYASIGRYYKFLNGKSETDVKQEFERFAPVYNRIIDLYNTYKVYQMSLTAVGKMIALANIKRVLPIDYKVWIK